MPKSIVFENIGAKGIHPKQTLGTKGLFKAPDGMLSYGQNVNSNSDEYGNGYLTPGFGYSSITGNTNLTGLPIGGAYSTISAQRNYDMISGLAGNTDRISRIKDIYASGNPQLAANLGAGGTDYELTVAHSGHASTVLHDIINFNDAGTNEIYVTGRDATDKWLAEYPAGATNPTITFTTFTDTAGGSAKNWLFVGDDDKLYMSKNNRTIVEKTALDTALVNLKVGYLITGMYKYGNYMAITYATNDEGIFGITQRVNKGSSGIALWNYLDTTIDEYIPLPDISYISAAINTIDGNLLVFGGKNNGTGLYLFTGSGFRKLIHYVADMPRSRHAVALDREGRVVWITADGYLMRYNIQTGILENLSTVTSTDSQASILISLTPSTTDTFAVSHMVTTVETISLIDEANFVGSTSDTNLSAVGITPLTSLPANSRISKMTVYLKENLATGDKIRFRLMKNGRTDDVSTIGTADFSVDGAIGFKEFTIGDANINSFAIEITWQMTNNNGTAPAIDRIEVDFAK